MALALLSRRFQSPISPLWPEEPFAPDETISPPASPRMEPDDASLRVIRGAGHPPFLPSFPCLPARSNCMGGAPERPSPLIGRVFLQAPMHAQAVSGVARRRGVPDSLQGWWMGGRFFAHALTLHAGERTWRAKKRHIDGSDGAAPLVVCVCMCVKERGIRVPHMGVRTWQMPSRGRGPRRGLEPWSTEMSAE